MKEKLCGTDKVGNQQSAVAGIARGKRTLRVPESSGKDEGRGGYKTVSGNHFRAGGGAGEPKSRDG